ncbi:tannase/feruloyl esterase family alpha/beta hydrolase [Amycolatopsis sp. YIM 10]|uniref:tannase/feruloyl esterase family alpha/beta hydrolase n=1 Tax=Amycolatopsis sp. YIM 10 TaxID=2653857 RepID=UPI00128FD145|nr:tannase/feruloyl esterase family alpha/beta hydrolase [Amycolatopsis sp. YIM 10]QFU88504.1 Tannase and feruloyl esterase [Amycolatopsis sp. YIM 10]
MKRLAVLLMAAIPIAALLSFGSFGASAAPLGCTAPAVSAPPGARIESVDAARVADPAHCLVTVTLTHDGGDHVKVAVALPESGWTGRLQAVGGSAYAAGDFGAPLAQAVRDGYAGVTTDAGVSADPLNTSWALKPDGELNTTLLTNFATRSVHESAVIGKEVTRNFYRQPITYSYWNGCSTGGRQGYAEAQHHPGDFDGVLAVAPAVHWGQFAVATLWPHVVMNQEHHSPGPCVLNAFREAAIKACDPRDGVVNGIVDQPDQCGYDPRQLVGTKVLCDGEEVTVTAADADVVRKIWAGPVDEHGRKLWAGLPKGADFTWLTGPTGFPVAAAWVKDFVKKQPGFDTSTITYPQFAELFRQSVREFDDVIGTADPDLSDFRRSGGKLLSWVGADDQLIPPDGVVRYREAVERKLGGAHRVDEFYRLFFAPGVEHCFGGVGPAPKDPLGALVNWVEHDKAPDVLRAEKVEGDRIVTRDLCRYPRVSRYTGHGDPAQAANYRCR